ncbi:hypothetical protein BN903_61 [Halorubrum sp. AJ67]|nr:hypothetical protein BN903_61 [Halorubrum sp. AJ67]
MTGGDTPPADNASKERPPTRRTSRSAGGTTDRLTNAIDNQPSWGSTD